MTLDLAEPDDRAGTVLLKGEVASLVAPKRIDPLHGFVPVDQDGDAGADSDHLVREPLIRSVRRFQNDQFPHAAQAALEG